MKKNSSMSVGLHKCPEKLGNFHSSRCSELIWIRPWATWSNIGISPSGSKGRDLQSSLHTEISLSLWNFDSLVLWKVKVFGAVGNLSFWGPRQRSFHVHPSPWWCSFPDTTAVAQRSSPSVFVCCWSSSRSLSHPTAPLPFAFWLSCQIPQTVSPHGGGLQEMLLLLSNNRILCLFSSSGCLSLLPRCQSPVEASCQFLS